MLKIKKNKLAALRSTMETHETEKREGECWRAGSLHLKWGGKASLEKVTFEQRSEGKELWRHEGFWISGVKGIPGRKSKVKTLKCSWRNLSKDRWGQRGRLSRGPHTPGGSLWGLWFLVWVRKPSGRFPAKDRHVLTAFCTGSPCLLCW